MRLRIPATVPSEHLTSVLKLNGGVNSDDVIIDGVEHGPGTLQFLGLSSKRDGRLYHGTYTFDTDFRGTVSEPFSFAENLPGLVSVSPDPIPPVTEEGDET